MQTTRKWGQSWAIFTALSGIVACQGQAVDYFDDSQSGSGSASGSGATGGNAGEPNGSGSTANGSGSADSGSGSTGNGSGSTGNNDPTGGFGNAGGEPSVIEWDSWPTLPSEPLTAGAIDPFDFEASGCSPDDFPSGSGDRWLQRLEDGSMGPISQIRFAEGEAGIVPVVVTTILGAELGVWETELQLPAGLVGSPVYWIGAIGGTPLDPSFGMGVTISPPAADFAFSFNEHLQYYFSPDGQTYAPITELGPGGAVLHANGFIFRAAEAGGYTCVKGNGAGGEPSN